MQRVDLSPPKQFCGQYCKGRRITLRRTMRLVKDRVFSDILNILPYPICVCSPNLCLLSICVLCVEARVAGTLHRVAALWSAAQRGFWLSGVGPPPSKPYPRHTQHRFSRYFPLKIELLPRLRLGLGSIQAWEYCECFKLFIFFWLCVDWWPFLDNHIPCSDSD